MHPLLRYIREVPDFPKPGILFRDIAPLLREQFEETTAALAALFTAEEWRSVQAVAGIESRGFILGAALAARQGLGFVPIRKKGKLPPPVVDVPYVLEYGTGYLEMQRGEGRVVVIDDVLATGGTLAAGATVCEQAGYAVTGLGVLMDLKLTPGFVWKGMAARAVLV